MRLRPHPEVRVDPRDAALDEARDERGVAELTVTAYAGNERALAFYARHGFAPRSVILARPFGG